MAAEKTTGVKLRERCLTEIREVEFEYEWIIRKFGWTLINMKEMRSFLSITGSSVTGDISICPEDDWSGQELPEHAKISLKLTTAESARIFICTEVSATVGQETKQFLVAKNILLTSSYEYVDWSHMFFLDDLLNPVDDSETVTISLDFKVTTMITGTPTDELQVKMAECSSAYNFGKVLKDPKYSDVTITVGSRKFRVHQIILADRSSVFAAMFESKMKENESSNVDITDMSEETVEEMLKFIYTDKTDKLEDMTNELLDAAEKYDLGTLKDLCVYSLRKNLNCSNAAESLILADRYKLKETKVEILKFISHHRKSVGGTHGYNGMREKYPRLLLETFEIM